MHSLGSHALNHVETILDHAERSCRENGSRLTDKRKLVLSGLLESQKALSAYELMEACKENYGTSIPAMSVYRILDFLESEQLVHKLNLANKYVACSHITCDHAHEVPQFLICGNCQKVREITIRKATLKELQDSVKKAGFSLSSPQIEMNCLCDDCQSAKA